MINRLAAFFRPGRFRLGLGFFTDSCARWFRRVVIAYLIVA